MVVSKISLAILYFMALAMAHLSLAQNSNQDFVDAHNKVRAHVGVGPLQWNDTVAAYAQNYAKKRSLDCNLEHSSGPYGENIAEGSGNFTGLDAMNMWAGEINNYDYRSNLCVGGECLHYTQVVWQNSVHIGCARVLCRNGWWFITCNYDPPGNWEGERPYY